MVEEALLGRERGDEGGFQVDYLLRPCEFISLSLGSCAWEDEENQVLIERSLQIKLGYTAAAKLKVIPAGPDFNILPLDAN